MRAPEALRTAAAGMLVVAAVTGWAQLVDARANGAELVVNEVTVARLRTARGRNTPALRAREAAQTLSAYDGQVLVGVDSLPSGRGECAVMMGARRVITVTEAEAKAQSSTPLALASTWADAIQSALGLPRLLAGSTEIATPPDRPAALTLVGFGARKAAITQNPPGLVTVTRSQGRLALRPRRKGRASLIISSGAEKVEVKVAVLPYALSLPASTSAMVLGNPATEQDVSSAVRAAMERLSLIPKGRLSVKSLVVEDVASGSSKTFTASVRAEGPDAFPTEGEVSITVRNIGLMPRNETQLWYSNDPENVKGEGRLYWGRLNPGQTIRLLAHHKNAGRRDLAVFYALANPGTEPAAVSLSMGDARPDQNPTLAGYVAGDSFLRSWMHQSGEIITIPPGKALPLIIRRIKPEETMSALGVIGLKSGLSSPVILISEARDAGGLPYSWAGGGSFPDPWTKLAPIDPEQEGISLTGTPKHVYAPPIKEQKFQHEAGRFSFIRVGADPILPESGGSYSELEGNFGVHYRFAGTIRNSTESSQPVEIVYEASAGYSGAVFIVNGNYVPARLLQASQTVRLWTKVMAPGEVQQVVIQTIPLSGAHYPATIIVRPVDSIK